MSRHILVLISLPVMIGVLAFIGAGWEAIVSLSSVFGWIVGIVLALWVLGSLFEGLGSLSSTPHDELLNKLDTPLEEKWVRRIDERTYVLHADGYAFELQDMKGRLHWREIEPNSGQPLETWVHADPRSAHYRGGEGTVAAEHITRRINMRKGY